MAYSGDLYEYGTSRTCKEICYFGVDVNLDC